MVASVNERLSVIVTIYNIEEYLEYCIDSIINQTYQCLEVILVDDGSTDSSGRICDAFSMKDNRIKVIHKENGGRISARYAGLQESTAQYIAFVDGDDWIKPNMYERLMELAVRENVDIVVSGSISYWDEYDWMEAKDDAICPGKYDRAMLDEKIIPRMLWRGGDRITALSSYLWNKIFKKNILLQCHEKLKEYTFNYGEDSAIVYPYMLKINSAYITHDCYYFYRRRNRGTIAPYIQNDDFFKDLYDLYAYLKIIFKDDKRYPVLKKQLEYYYITLVSMRKQNYNDRSRNEIVYLFPFNKVDKGSRIIIYGAGKVGLEYYEQVTSLQYCEIIQWVDKNYFNYEDNRIHDIKSIRNAEYDYLVIAIASKESVQLVAEAMINMGVPKEKIIFPYING